MTETLVFGYYPYVAAIMFLGGSLLKLRRDVLSWRDGTAPLCHIGPLSPLSKLFHVSVLALLLGHVAGMLIPYSVYHALGLSATIKQLLAVIVGGSFGLLCLAGLVYYTHRRLTSAEKRAIGTKMDLFVLVFLGLELVLGLMTLPVSLWHLDGNQMLILSEWAGSIVTLHPGAAELLVDVSWIFKLHLFFGITLFVLVPFSHLGHMWTVPLRYLLYPNQVVIERKPGI